MNKHQIKQQFQQKRIAKLVQLMHKGKQMQGNCGDHSFEKVLREQKEWQDKQILISHEKNMDRILYNQDLSNENKDKLYLKQENMLRDAMNRASLGSYMKLGDFIQDGCDELEDPAYSKDAHFHDLCMLKNTKPTAA